jgi:hypothetical protein
MNIVHSDAIFRVEPGTTPNYNQHNSMMKLVDTIEKVRLAAERECYLTEHLQYLFAVKHLEMYGPSSPNEGLFDPTQQDVKTDFQKQNVRDFLMADTYLLRGWVAINDWTAPFLRISYRGGPTSRLASAAGNRLGNRIKLWLKVGSVSSPSLISVPYNPETHRYEVELWGYGGDGLLGQLDTRGRAAIDRGELLLRTDLLRGRLDDFARDGMSDKYVVQVMPESTMHPILPLHIEIAWTDEEERVWDSQGGSNYHYEFNMLLRGWDNYLGVGMSANPHGGIGYLEYRNLLSNYGRYAGRGELGRALEAWNFDAFGRKDHGNRREDFFALEYMDLHILKGNAGIGLHRHRDNQEAFFLMEGRGLMVVGDWCKSNERERCFEVRTLRPGHMAMLKGGNLHGLINVLDEDAALLMFGGYD